MPQREHFAQSAEPINQYMRRELNDAAAFAMGGPLFDVASACRANGGITSVACRRMVRMLGSDIKAERTGIEAAEVAVVDRKARVSRPYD